MQPPVSNIPYTDDRRQNPLDEPPWSPELLELIAQVGQVWLCHDGADAELLLRPDAGDLPALCLPLAQVSHWLTPELGTRVQTTIVLQRQDPGLDDEAFYTRYGQQVKHQLQAIGWRGTLYRVPLNEVVPTLAHLWTSPAVHEDRACFQFELVNLQHAGIREEIRGQRQRQRQQAQGPRPILVSADQVEAQPLQWLWEPYVPRGMLVMLDGDPGLGKSLMVVKVAAHLSRGQPFLDQLGKPTRYADVEGPQATLILSAEESLEYSMVPRLTRAGADLKRITFLQGWLGPEDEERIFDLRHLGVLIQALEAVKPVLVILDPLVAYLGDIDMHKASQTRPLMAALAKLGDRYGCTILGVRHPGKTDQGGPLMYRGQGNLDIIGAARSGLWVQKHPAHPETHTLLLQSKTNIGKLGRTLILTRQDGDFDWVGVSRLSEGMLTGKGPDPWAMLEAFFWLEERMRPGLAYKAADLEQEANERGIGRKPLERAKKLLGITSQQVTGGWTWTLPPLS